MTLSPDIKIQGRGWELEPADATYKSTEGPTARHWIFQKMNIKYVDEKLFLREKNIYCLLHVVSFLTNFTFLRNNLGLCQIKFIQWAGLIFLDYISTFIKTSIISRCACQVYEQNY